jgi:hypothetical protein
MNRKKSVSAPVLEGRGNHQGTYLRARGHSDMNSIQPHSVRVQFIQLVNKVSSHSRRAPMVQHLSLLSALGNAASTGTPGSLTGTESQRSKILSLSTFALKFQIALGIFLFLPPSAKPPAPFPGRGGNTISAGGRCRLVVQLSKALVFIILAIT